MHNAAIVVSIIILFLTIKTVIILSLLLRILVQIIMDVRKKNHQEGDWVALRVD